MSEEKRFSPRIVQTAIYGSITRTAEVGAEAGSQFLKPGGPGKERHWDPGLRVVIFATRRLQRNWKNADRGSLM